MSKVNIDKIAKRLGATRRGTVEARSGYFGAMELLAEVHRHFQPIERPTKSETQKSQRSS